MRTQDLEYVVDGQRYVGHLAFDDDRAGARPAVLVAHEGGGLDEHAKGRARRLAGLGYVAFALDYYGDGKPPPRQEIPERLGPLIADAERTRVLGRAGLDVLLAQPQADAARVAAIGFCFGGTMALELARAGSDLKAVVGFHSGLATSQPAAPASIVGTILVCIGAEDPLIPLEQRQAFEQEMRDAGADWQMNVYADAVHSFTNELVDELGIPSVAYHRRTDERSWRAMLDRFEESFGPL